MNEAETIAKAWKLTDDERCQLFDNREDFNLCVSIHDSLSRIYEYDSQRADAWIRKPNRAFGGQPALSVMLTGNIEQVHKYLKYHLYNA